MPDLLQRLKDYASFFKQNGRDDLVSFVTEIAEEHGSLLAERDHLRAEREAAVASVDGCDLREGHVRDNTDPDQLRAMLLGAGLKIAELRAERDKLQRFKDWVHAYLDGKGVPHHPPGSHGAEGCRIGDRMDFVWAELDALRQERELTKRLLTKMNWHIANRGLLVGECVTWDELKKLHGVIED